MKVVVTGSSGFIGGWLCRLLRRQGHVVTGLDVRPPALADDVDSFVECDILDAARLKRSLHGAEPAGLIHLAARVDLDETEQLSGYAANIDGVENLLEAIREAPSIRRAIYTSSQLVCRVGYVPGTDTDYRPNTLYGQSKVRTEEIVRGGDGGGVEWCLVRPTTVWGPQMSSHYQTLLRMIRKRLYFHSGSGKLYKSFSFAGNIAHQYLKLLEAPAPQMHSRTFYLCDYQPLSLREYADGLAEAMGAPVIPTLPVPAARLLARAGDLLSRLGVTRVPFNTFRLNNILTEYVFDTEELHRICGPLPFNPSTGMAMTAKWYRDIEQGRPSAPASWSADGNRPTAPAA